MSRETDYYIAAGRSLEAIERYQREAIAHKENGRALQNELGAEGVFERVNQIVGFKFPEDAELPRGLRWHKDYKYMGMAVPNLRFREGKRIRDRLCDPECPSTWKVNAWIMGDDNSMYFLGPYAGKPGAGAIGIVGFERLGDDWVLKVPAPDKGKAPAPLDAVPMKRSEYWARKEAQEAATAG